MNRKFWTIFVFIICVLTSIKAADLQEVVLEPIFKDVALETVINIETNDRNYDYKRCSIEMPTHLENHGELEFEPNPSKQLPNNIGRSMIGTGCSLNIRNVEQKYAGKWIMRSYAVKKSDDNSSYVLKQEFTLRIVTTVSSIPKSHLSIAEGSDLYFRLEKTVKDMIECSARLPDNTTHSLWKKDNEQQASKGNAVQYWRTSADICGVKVSEVKNAPASGYWHIEATDIHKNLYTAKIDISITDPQNNIGESYSRQHSLTLGTTKTLDLTPKGATWCRARSTKEGLDDSCRIELNPVKRSDAKTWQISWVQSGNPNIQTADVQIMVYEPQYINTNVEKLVEGDRTSYNLMCRIESKVINHCIYERPDGKILNLNVGVGNGRYSYYGKGFSNPTFDEVISECGLTIENAQSEDMGVWRCMMGDANQKEETSAIAAYLTVGPKISEEDLPHSAAQSREAFITQDLKISCWIRSTLDYCWIQHPNGTTFTRGELDSTVKIFDLRAGLCGMEFRNVTTDDAGVWSCRMGVAGGTELTTKYDVAVFDNKMLRLNDSTVNAESSSSISCRAINNEPLTYCRFVRPDGVGIHSRGQQNEIYQFTGDIGRGECNLNIKLVTKSDFGTWQCSGGLLDDNEEITVPVRLRIPEISIIQSTTPLVLIAMSGTALIVLAVLAVIYKLRGKTNFGIPTRYSRRAMPKPEDPVPFYLPADSPITSKA